MRFALIGCGEIGRARAAAVERLARSGAAGVPGARLVVVADAARDRAEALAARHRCRALTDGEEAARFPEADAVIVSTPPNLHAPLALAALRAGKPVLVEKPLAATLDDARAIVAEAAARGLAVGAGFNIRHFLAFRRAHEILASGAIGELDHVRAVHGHPGGSEFGHAWIHDASVTGGGTLVDNGIHILDLARWFLGEVVEAKGYATGGVWKFSGCEDAAHALFRSADGKIATVRSSWTEWQGYGFAVEAYGTRGMVRASYPPMMLRVATAERDGSPIRRRTEIFPAFQIAERMRSWRWTLVESLAAEMAEFVSAIAAGRDPSPSGRDGLRALEMAHAVYRSSESGETVGMNEGVS